MADNSHTAQNNSLHNNNNNNNNNKKYGRRVRPTQYAPAGR